MVTSEARAKLEMETRNIVHERRHSKTPSVHLEAGRVEVGHVGDEIEGVGFVRRVLLLPPVQGLSSLRIQRWGDSPHLGAGRVEAREVIPEKVGGARVGGRGRRALK